LRQIYDDRHWIAVVLPGGSLKAPIGHRQQLKGWVFQVKKLKKKKSKKISKKVWLKENKMFIFAAALKEKPKTIRTQVH